MSFIITSREKEVLQFIALEFTSKEIASHLFISTETVNTHRGNLKDKLSVRNTAGMVRRGFELGLLELQNA